MAAGISSNDHSFHYHSLMTPLAAAYRSSDRVSGTTHPLYRYPARFSPDLVRSAIDAFSERGDYVVDPFVGGGTSAVEALALGRRFIGFDISPLAVLLSRAKTTPLSGQDVRALETWYGSAAGASVGSLALADPRLRNAPIDVALALEPFIAAIPSLISERRRLAARAVVLDAGQRAVDGRAIPLRGDRVPSLVRSSLNGLLGGLAGFAAQIRSNGDRPSVVSRRRVLRVGDAAKLASSTALNRLAHKGRLVVTSPPYPGIHVLYHRWQVGGRTETAMPFWIADELDGAGPKHYTLGGRSRVGQDYYFQAIKATWSSVRRLLAQDAVVVQLVAFARPDEQLPKYLDAMTGAGFVRDENAEPSGWRVVPNRRWYYRVKPEREQAREALLIHRIAAR